MRPYKKILGIAFLLMSMGFVACSNDDGPVQDKKSKFTMKVDGKEWTSSVYNQFTEKYNNDKFGTYYVVTIGGQQLKEASTTSSAITLYVAIPESKFNNPKGSYNLRREKDMGMGDATALYIVSSETGQTWYGSVNPAKPTEIVGKLEINGFEIGQQKMGGQLGTEGYTKLSGTFKLDVYSPDDSGSPVRITDGEFNLDNLMGFGF